MFFVLILTFLLPLAIHAQQPPSEPKRMALAAPAPATLPKRIDLETIFGTIAVTEPVLIELLNHKCMTRIKDIDQHGVLTYFENYPTFNRYDHCIGVFGLLHKFNCPLTEQIAGLLHDASHTVFSHLADHFFKTGNMDAYQDGIHDWFLEKMGLETVLKKYGYAIADIMPEQEHFTGLEQDLPFMCADRIEYNLHTGLAFGRITQDELKTIVGDLRFEDGTWFFVNQASARKLADLSLYFTENFWSAPVNTVLQYWLVSALRQAVARELVSFDQIHFGIDKTVLDILDASTDKHIQEMLTKCRNAAQYYEVVSGTTPYDLVDYPKCRGINVLVKNTSGELVHLAELDQKFKDEYNRVKRFTQRGNKIRFLKPTTA